MSDEQNQVISREEKLEVLKELFALFVEQFHEAVMQQLGMDDLTHITVVLRDNTFEKYFVVGYDDKLIGLLGDILSPREGK